MTPEMLQVRAFFKNLFKYLRRCIITPMQVIKFNFLSDTFLAAAQHFHFFFGRGGGGDQYGRDKKCKFHANVISSERSKA